jgi:hypothetical protein
MFENLRLVSNMYTRRVRSNLTHYTSRDVFVLHESQILSIRNSKSVIPPIDQV